MAQPKCRAFIRYTIATLDVTTTAAAVATTSSTEKQSQHSRPNNWHWKSIVFLCAIRIACGDFYIHFKRNGHTVTETRVACTVVADHILPTIWKTKTNFDARTKLWTWNPMFGCRSTHTFCAVARVARTTSQMLPLWNGRTVHGMDVLLFNMNDI